MKKVFNLDRRIIFLFIFLSVLIPLMIDFKLPIKAGRNVQIVYDKIETVAAKNGTILVSFDFDTASKPELEPMARAVIAHAMMRNVKVVAMGNWPNGVELAKETMRSLAQEYNKVEGTDWAYLGYKPGAAIVIISMGRDLKSAFPTDYRTVKTSDMPITRDIKTLKDFDYVVSFAAGSGGIEEWVIYGSTKFGFDLGGGCTAVMAPDFFPFLQSGQLKGIIGGLAGAAQYEALINKPAFGFSGMRPQSVAHIVLIFFILFGNVCYLMDKFYFQKRKEGAQ
jgi:hypothetical protein